ncbi:MAG: AmmeMemoRadiSam system protein B [Candidatus Sulfotelmatobacter sp.]|jgi:AmmeMemoRadiSam system protein B
MTATPVRHPAVAGRFYPRDPEALRQEVHTYLSRTSPHKTIRALGCIAPHAGYIYSGHVAGAVFSTLEIPQLCVVMCPNHTGMGRPLAIMSEGTWETPLGPVPVASDFAADLKQRCPLLQEDSAAHRSEHAAEVELPFLQIRQPKLSFVPIALGTGQFEALEQLGVALAEAVTAYGKPVLIIASSDMNHYESDAITRIKDQSAIEPILQLDARTLHHVVTQQHVSMCGFGPAIAMLTAAKRLGATSAELVKYATSGDISGDRDMVVGYAGIVVR